MPKPSSMPDMPRLKIGFVLDDSLDRPDGVQQYVLTTGEWLRKQGHDVHYLVSTTRRRDLVHVHDLANNIGVTFNGNQMHTPLPASTARIRHLLAQEKFDVLHVQMPYSPLLAGRVIKAAGPNTAIVGTFHIVPRSWLVGLASRLLAIWARSTLNRFDQVLCVSPAAQNFAQKTFGIMSIVLPNAIWLDTFKTAKPYVLPEARATSILFLGRLVPRKGCMLLLQAAVLLKQDKSMPPFSITICGKGPLDNELHRFVSEHNLDSTVVFKGFVSEADKPRYYASADITVFPSLGGESFGIVLVEAMAAGHAAVLAGDNEGYRSVMEPSPNDVLFDPRNAAALANKLSMLLRDRALRKHIAAWQQHHAETYDIERIGKELTKVYISALQRRRNMR